MYKLQCLQNCTKRFFHIAAMLYYIRNVIKLKPNYARLNSCNNGLQSASGNGIKWVAGGWVLFLGENVILSENREWICERYGEKLYHGIYNTLSSAACISILYGFVKHKGRGQRWAKFEKGSAPPHLRVASILLQSCGLICFSQLLPKLQIPVSLHKNEVATHKTDNLATEEIAVSSVEKSSPVVPPTGKFTFKARCPMDFRSKPDLPPDAVYGVERITRHHNLWALASLGVGAALVTPFMVESLFFAGPLLLATFGTAHQDSRFRRNMGGTLSPEKEERTSNIPFAALLTGRQEWKKLLEEIKWLNGGIATLIILALHVI